MTSSQRRCTRALSAAILCGTLTFGVTAPGAQASAPSDHTVWAGAFGQGYVMLLAMSGVHEGAAFTDALYYCIIEHRVDERHLICSLSSPPVVGTVPAEFGGPATEERNEQWICLNACSSRLRVGTYAFDAVVFGGRTLACDGATAAEFPSAHSGGTFGTCTLR